MGTNYLTGIEIIDRCLEESYLNIDKRFSYLYYITIFYICKVLFLNLLFCLTIYSK